jgi:hypothetical protein
MHRKVGENIQALLQQSSNLIVGSQSVGAYACTARIKPSNITRTKNLVEFLILMGRSNEI